MHPIERQPLIHLQEKLCHVTYILINEMSFIGPKILSQIDDRLREVFPSYQNVPFTNQPFILVGKLGKLPLMKDISMYVDTSRDNALWHNLYMVITLSTIFHQQGTNPLQITFRQLLMNVKNETPIVEDWNLLM